MLCHFVRRRMTHLSPAMLSLLAAGLQPLSATHSAAIMPEVAADASRRVRACGGGWVTPSQI